MWVPKQVNQLIAVISIDWGWYRSFRVSLAAVNTRRRSKPEQCFEIVSACYVYTLKFDTPVLDIDLCLYFRFFVVSRWLKARDLSFCLVFFSWPLIGWISNFGRSQNDIGHNLDNSLTTACRLQRSSSLQPVQYIAWSLPLTQAM